MAKMKLKTHSGAKKRFKLTKNGKIKDVYKRQLLRGADMTENLTILAKTGLCALTEPQVCALENYAYTWSCLLYTSRCV